MRHGRPFFYHIGVKGPVIGAGWAKAQEIPAACRQMYPAYRFAPRAAPHWGQSICFQLGVRLSGLPGVFKNRISSGSTTGAGFRHRHGPQSSAMDDRNRVPNSAGAENAPVAQPPVGLGLAPPFGVGAIRLIVCWAASMVMPSRKGGPPPRGGAFCFFFSTPGIFFGPGGFFFFFSRGVLIFRGGGFRRR